MCVCVCVCVYVCVCTLEWMCTVCQHASAYLYIAIAHMCVWCMRMCVYVIVNE